MDDVRQTALAYLERLTTRGRHIAERLQTTPDAAVDIRAWQQDCATAINELSGGSKAHWLSRAFSQAFLVRSAGDGGGGVVTEASAADIVDRLLAVLAQARASLEGMDPVDAAATAAPAPRRFDFVHNAELRPILEQAYAQSAQAFEAGDFQHAFMTSCSILEAVITDALLKVRLPVPRSAAGTPDTTRDDDSNPGETVEGTFDARIAAAERAGLIRGGCARLPASARTYRDLAPGTTVSEREAKVVRQVLNVVMRDLDPGR